MAFIEAVFKNIPQILIFLLIFNIGSLLSFEVGFFPVKAYSFFFNLGENGIG
jgi:hypothetical protein